jgi:hypothetical protein
VSESIVANPLEFQRRLDQSYDRFEKKWRLRMQRLMKAAMIRLIRRTPVHTGQAVRSYVASAGSAYSGAAGSKPNPVEPTNKLALGAEALRGGAEAVAMGTLASVDYSDPFNVFWITNTAPHIGGLEAGELPRSPLTPRSPQGMFAVTLQELLTFLDSDKL